MIKNSWSFQFISSWLLLLSLIVGCFIAAPAQATDQESAYARVMRTGILRCGYRSWPPNLQKDPNTGQLSGIYYDYVEELAKRLSLKVVWSEELGAGEFITALQARRIDVMCFGAWPNAQRARMIDFVQPIYYEAIYAYARTKDTRFDNHIELINRPETRIGVIDGSTSLSIAQANFPKATLVSLPEMNTGADLFLQLATGKVDVIFNDLHTAKIHEAHNPNKVRQIKSDGPLRIFGPALSVAKGEFELLNTLNIATNELIFSGAAEKMIRKYEKYPGSFYRPAKPYVVEK